MSSPVRVGTAVLGTAALLVPLAVMLPISPALAAAPPGTWNLAPDATITASSHQDDVDGYFPPENAIDGNLATRWSSANGPDEDVPYEQWLELDLGQLAEVSGLTLEWEAAHAAGYSVEVAATDPDAGGTWQEVYATTTGTGGTEDVTFETVAAQWVRLSMTDRVSFDWEAPTLHWYGYSLFEIDVWGTTAQPTLGFSGATTVVDAGTPATVPVTLSAPAADEVTVRVTSADGSAIAGEDYTAIDEVLTFPAGTTEQSVTVESIDHGPLAGDRSLTLALSDLTGAVILGARDQHTVTLRAHGELPSDGARIPIDDFEDGVGAIFPWGDGAASTPTLSTIASTRPEGGSALQAEVPGMTSWGGFSHDFTEPAEWVQAGAFSLWFLGTASGNDLRFELKSGGSSAGSATLFEHTVTDDTAGWREVVVQFSDLREKGNPSSTERFDPTNVWGYAVTLSDLGAGTWVFDDVAIVERSLMIMDFEGEVPLSTDADPVGVFAWGGDDASKPTLEVIADDRGGTAVVDNHVLSGTYQVTTWGGISHNLAAAQNWSTFGGIRFWWYASQDTRPASPTAGASIRVEIKDGGPHGEASELWETSFLDNWSTDGSRWKLVELPFSAFTLRTDYQAGSGATLDGELTLDRAWGYALTMPAGTDTPVGYRIDDVELYGSAQASSGITIAPQPQTVLVDGGEDAVVTVAATTRDGEALPSDVSLTWALTPGSAEEGVDYAADGGTLTFAAGDPSGTSQQITVPTLARDGEQFARTIEVALTSDDAPVTSSATITINAQQMPYLDASLPTAERVADLLGRMTLAEKIGQMTQAERLGLSSPQDVATYLLGSVLSGGGSVPADNTPSGWADMVDGYQRAALSTRLQIPIVYGVDAVHGHSNMVGATIFPHNIGIGAARDPGLIQAQGQVTAAEVRASGIPWTFAPTLAVSGDERWGRSYESFGEDPALVSLYAGPAIRGLQGADPGSIDGATEVLATAKHWLGDGSTSYDAGAPGYPIDQGISHYDDEDDLWATDVVPYLPALAAGVGSIMPSYSAVAIGDGEPVRMHENTALNTDLLKDQLGFEGFLISDWEGINKLSGASYAAKAVSSVNSGMDMAMAPYDYAAFISAITTAVQTGEVSLERVDDAVERILTQKFALGLFDAPFADRTGSDEVGSSEHRAVARQAAADSQVLLSNDGVLPLSTDANVYVAGSTANDLGRQMGGWTISWQGGSGATTQGTTIGAAITAATTGEVTISPDASAPMDGADVGVVVVGEPPYAEGVGDVGENGFTLELRPNDVTTIERVCAELDCVVLVVSGRPQVTSGLTEVNALVASWLPGSEGDGVADVLFGARPYTGRLPVTWPAAADQVPVNVGDADYDPQFAFGWGLRTDDPQQRLRDLADSLPAGAAQDAVRAAAEAAYWGQVAQAGGQAQASGLAHVEVQAEAQAPAQAQEVLGLLQRAGAQLRGVAAFGEADLAVSAARDIVQSVIAGATPGYTVASDQASLTSGAEHALLTGEAGTSVRLLAAAIGIELAAADDVPGEEPTEPGPEPTEPGPEPTEPGPTEPAPTEPAPTDAATPPGGGGGGLPSTGAAITGAALLAAALLGAGTAALLRRRHSRGTF